MSANRCLSLSVADAPHLQTKVPCLEKTPVEAPVVAIKTTCEQITFGARYKKGSVKWVVRRMATTIQSSVIPFTPAARSAAADGVDQVDKAGQTILGLLHRAAGVAEANSQHALEMAQKLSHQLRAAEDRIAELEAEVGMYKEKADRAEQWLHTVYTEIEDRFLRQDDGRRGAPQRRQGAHGSRRADLINPLAAPNAVEA